MSLTLDAPEQELVAAEAAHYAARVTDPDARAAYERLAAAALQGEIGDDLLAPLGALLGLGLSSGRLRAAYGPHGEMAAAAVYRRTPAGQRLQQEVAAANTPLAALAGQSIRQITISQRGPGLYTLTLQTDRCHLNVALDPGGVAVRSLEFAL